MASAFTIFSETLAASRRRDGLRALSNAEMSAAFRAPAYMRRGASLSGQAASDSMWAGIVARLNATIPTPIGTTAGSGHEPTAQREVDWSSIVSGLNRNAP
jgi:hypothetical protein